MRPLIEILEDERKLLQKLESIYRYMTKIDDDETFDILAQQKKRIERDLDKIHRELCIYLENLSIGGEDGL